MKPVRQYEEVGAILGMSGQMVRVIEARALLKCRRAFAALGITAEGVEF